jgi:hypothetical protein
VWRGFASGRVVTRYRTIVADPPWAYREGFGIGRTPRGRQNDGRRNALPYQEMSLDQINHPAGDGGQDAPVAPHVRPDAI